MHRVLPVICMITDRARMGADWQGSLAARTAAAARAGVHLIQVRERDLDGGPLARVVEQCVAGAKGTGARVVVNDRVDVALAAGAHGVHLRGDSAGASRVRRMVPPGFLIGRSVRSEEELAGAVTEGGLDYIIFGTVFETSSKPGMRPAGVSRLARIAGATTIPVLGVGGVTPGRAGEVARAGAAGVAAIRLFSSCGVNVLPDIVRALSRAFDTAVPVTYDGRG